MKFKAGSPEWASNWGYHLSRVTKDSVSISTGTRIEKANVLVGGSPVGSRDSRIAVFFHRALKSQRVIAIVSEEVAIRARKRDFDFLFKDSTINVDTVRVEPGVIPGLSVKRLQ